jgi:serine/threonine protein kinase
VHLEQFVKSLDVALGLEYLHGEGIIHGDLKAVRQSLALTWITPMTILLQLNVLVLPSRRACLSDFGLATARDSKPTVRTYMSTSQAGTPRWQAPELFPDMLNPDAPHTDSRNTFATDIYAFAMVCYEVSGPIFTRNTL